VNSETRRPLVLISKAIQNLANEVRFGKKEEYMFPVNEFIDRNLTKIRDFFDEITIVPRNVMEYEPLASIEEVSNKELPEVFNHIKLKLEQVAKSLIDYNNADAVGGLASLIARIDASLEN